MCKHLLCGHLLFLLSMSVAFYLIDSRSKKANSFISNLFKSLSAHYLP